MSKNRLNLYIMCMYANALDIYHNARAKGGWNNVPKGERFRIRRQAVANGWKPSYE